MSSIADLKKARAEASAPIKPGRWHAGFSAVHKFAVEGGIPILAVWADDACGNSQAFCRCLTSAEFRTWQKASGVVLWCGFHSDKGVDGFEGRGFQWARKGVQTHFPFVRLYWAGGNVDVCACGVDWGASGAAVVKRLKAYLKGYKQPAPAPAAAVVNLVALPCTASALETALHSVCDSGKWDGTVKYDGGRLVLEAKP